MAYYGKMAITLNANSVITATVADYPAYVKLTPTNCPSIFYAGVDATKVKFTSDAEGTTQLDHELVREAAAIIEYFVKTSAWTIYLWLGDDDEADTSNATGVWGTAKYIGHFVNDANDSSSNANHGTVTGATLTADANYLGGSYYAFNETNYITLPSGILNGLTEFTILTQIKPLTGTDNNDRIFDYDTTSWEEGVYAITLPTNNISSTSYDTTYRSASVPITLDTKYHISTVYSKNVKNLIFKNGSKSIGTIANATLSNKNSRIGRHVTTGLGFEGYVGYFWIFSEAKSDDFISAVYNNMEDYDNFVTIGSEGVITGVPFSIGEDKPIIRILDSSGNVMDNSLESGTYITFGTLPRGYATWVDIYIGEYLGFPLYNAVLTGVESDNQLGEADETYESLSAQIADDIGTDNWTDLPLTLGTVAKGQYYHVRLRYTAGDDMALGIKVFAIKVTGDWSG